MYLSSALSFASFILLAAANVKAADSIPCTAAVGYAPGEFRVNPFGLQNEYFATFCNGANATIQADGNFVVYYGTDHSGPGFSTATYPANCGKKGQACVAQFTGDGDFQVLHHNRVVFHTNTAHLNAQRLVISSGQPYVVIYDISGAVLFTSSVGEEAKKYAAPGYQE